MLRIAQISTADAGGGAELVAANLHARYRALGHEAWLLVGRRLRTADGTRRIDNAPGATGWARWWWWLDDGLGDRRRSGRVALRRMLRLLADPARALEQYEGREPMRFPGSRALLAQLPTPPDVVHAHNLHGNYFDLRVIPELSRRQPLVLTLHDGWLLTGHCAHAMNCPRWELGCGQCPDLTRYPSIRRDATRANWARKREIYATSRLYVVTPSQWLMDMVERSMLAAGVAASRVIPYGIDLDVFHPADRRAARRTLGLPEAGHVLLYIAGQGRNNVYKDPTTIQGALGQVARQRRSEPLTVVALGGLASAARLDNLTVQQRPFEHDPQRVAAYYQAADLYLHAACADTFPNTILESLACGTPVVATSVSGIPEQIEDGRTGALVPPGDGPAMAVAVERLLADADRLAEYGDRAARSAVARFDLNRQVRDYLTWYAEAQADFAERARVSG